MSSRDKYVFEIYDLLKSSKKYLLIQKFTKSSIFTNRKWGREGGFKWFSFKGRFIQFDWKDS